MSRGVAYNRLAPQGVVYFDTKKYLQYGQVFLIVKNKNILAKYRVYAVFRLVLHPLKYFLLDTDFFWLSQRVFVLVSFKFQTSRDDKHTFHG
jgi:hypothetical protein